MCRSDHQVCECCEYRSECAPMSAYDVFGNDDVVESTLPADAGDYTQDDLDAWRRQAEQDNAEQGLDPVLDLGRTSENASKSW